MEKEYSRHHATVSTCLPCLGLMGVVCSFSLIRVSRLAIFAISRTIFLQVSPAHRISRIISQNRNRERRSTNMEAKSDERFYTPRNSARRGYSSAGSEDERFVSPRTSARSVSSDDNEYTTPREHASSPTHSEDYLKRAAGKVSRLGVSELKQALPEYDEKPAKHVEAATSRGYSARPSSAASEIRNVQYVEAPAVPENDVFSAARHNRIDSVTYMLDQGISVNSKDAHGNTILSIACQNGLKRMAKLALRRGANINSQNNRGNTALHFCFAYGYGDSLGEYLISKGADTRIENDDGLVCYEGIVPRSPRK